MGFAAGEITKIEPNAPDAYYGVTITFSVIRPHYGYIWDDSRVKVSSDFLGNRVLEITKGKAGVPTIEEGTNQTPRAILRSDVMRNVRKQVLDAARAEHGDLERTNHLKFDWFVMEELKRRAYSDRNSFYTNLTEAYWIDPEESPALNERLEQVVNQVEEALPNILSLTNQLSAVLSNTAVLTAHLSEVAVAAQPAVSNLAIVTARLDQPGALGEWILPTNINQKLDAVLGGADSTLHTANTNIAVLAQTLNESLLNLANITSNFNGQVQANTNILSQVSKAVVDADNLVQGLKRHWLLRSAFKKDRKEESRESAPTSRGPVTSPKERGRR
jgi:ABC-type transporter Mla subunit MlaD